MVDWAGLAMHHLTCSDNLPTKYGTNALLAEANTKDRHLARKALNHRHGDAGLFRRAWAGRNTDPRGRPLLYFLETDRVVAVNLYLCAQFPEVLNDVPGEGIVVVDHQNHGGYQSGPTNCRRVRGFYANCRQKASAIQLKRQNVAKST